MWLVDLEMRKRYASQMTTMCGPGEMETTGNWVDYCIYFILKYIDIFHKVFSIKV